MNYKEKLKVLELKLEQHLDDILTDNAHRSVKAENYVLALMAGRQYLLEKMKKNGGKDESKIN